MEIATWVGAIATFLAVIVALFKEDIVRLWRAPKLTAKIRLEAPDCHKTEMVIYDKNTGKTLDKLNCYYFRLWVENIGRERAEKVQIFISKVMKLHADGKYRVEKSFLPMNLKWSHSQLSAFGPEIYAEGISPLMGKHCDLGHVIDPAHQVKVGENLTGVVPGETVFVLDLEVAPNTRSHLLAPGKYRMDLRIAAGNLLPITKRIELNLTGKWSDDEAKMFAEGIGIKDIE